MKNDNDNKKKKFKKKAQRKLKNKAKKNLPVQNSTSNRTAYFEVPVAA